MSRYEKITQVFIKSSNPCLYYPTVFKYHLNNNISDETWFEYGTACLDYLMKNNKEVLDRLKN